MNKFKRLFIILSIFLIFACSANKPIISDLSVKKLEIENDSELLIERLSVFLLFKDEDGRQDYNSIILIHKESGLSWTLNRNNSSFFTSETKSEDQAKKILWAGSNNIANPLGKFPSGDYSIIVEDLSGNRAIRNISLESENNLSKLPFTFEVTQDSWNIENIEESNFRNYSLILLGSDKQPIFVKILENNSLNKQNGNLKELKEKYPDARYIQCLAENSQKTIAYLSKAIKLY